MENKNRKIKFLTDEEIQRIIEKIKLVNRGNAMRDKAILETLFSTGLRVSEMLSLSEAPFVSCSVDTLELSIKGKGNFVRTVYFSPRCLKSIKDYLAVKKEDDSLLLFPITARGVQFIIKKRGEEAGFEGIHPHCLRHSFAVHLLKSGMNMYYLQQFMGHRALSSTSHYLHTTSRELFDMHKNIFNKE